MWLPVPYHGAEVQALLGVVLQDPLSQYVNIGMEVVHLAFQTLCFWDPPISIFPSFWKPAVTFCNQV